MNFSVFISHSSKRSTLTPVVIKQMQVIVEHHLHVHVNIARDKVVPTWIDAHKVWTTQHDLCVVDEEEGEQDNAIVRVDN